MLVLGQDNLYAAANMTVKVTDNTVYQNTAIEDSYPVPDFNILVPMVQEVGVTNVIELYRPGTQDSYATLHGMPNALKYGFAPDFIYDTLAQNAGVGVYTVNLRGNDATMANVVLMMDYTVTKNVQRTNREGEPLYIDSETGAYTTDSTKGDPALHDMLNVKYYIDHYNNVKSWAALAKSLDATDTSGNTEDSGTIPIFAATYRGASAFGNNSYFSMHKIVSEADHNTYYYATAYDGVNTVSTDATLSLYAYSGTIYNTSYFIENQFNNAFSTLRMHMFSGIDELYDLYNKFLSDYDLTFPAIDIFTFTGDGYMDLGPNIHFETNSLDPTKANAFSFTNGSDGNLNVDTLLCNFFEGKLLDIDSVIRYKVNYIPDVGYSDDVKASIIKCINNRNRFTTATLMVGGDTFPSAVIERQANYYENMPNVRLISKIQSPMMYNPYCRRTMTYPSSYFDCMEWVRLVGANGNPFMPFAGANVRWRGFIEDTMTYPTEDPDYINSLVLSRINFVMKDNAPGAYLSDQVMNTVTTSDLTEFNNSFIISSMLYDTLDIVHQNHFKFNESTEVARFTNLVDEYVNTKYRVYSASLDIKVYRKGTVGRAAQTNVISITVDLKDINRYAQVEITLIDE